MRGGVMKKRAVLVGVIFLLIASWLSGCPEQGVVVKKLTGTHPQSVNMTEEQMKQFPHLKEAIQTLTNGTNMIETPVQEMNQLRGILEYFDTEVVQYQQEYYEIKFYAAD
jgi:hypothetical protein